jgi:hypothetical protein
MCVCRYIASIDMALTGMEKLGLSGYKVDPRVGCCPGCGIIFQVISSANTCCGLTPCCAAYITISSTPVVCLIGMGCSFSAERRHPSDPPSCNHAISYLPSQPTDATAPGFLPLEKLEQLLEQKKVRGRKIRRVIVKRTEKPQIDCAVVTAGFNVWRGFVALALLFPYPSYKCLWSSCWGRKRYAVENSTCNLCVRAARPRLNVPFLLRALM